MVIAADWNADLVASDQHSETLAFSSGHINYRENGEWHRIGTDICHRSHGDSHWALEFPRLATGRAGILSKPGYSPSLRQILVPSQFSLRALSVLPVESSHQNGQIHYPGAYGPGTNLIYSIHAGALPQLRKVIRLGPEWSDRDLEFRFLIQCPAGSRATTDGFGLGVQDSGSGLRFGRPFVWDEFGSRREIRLELRQIDKTRWLLRKIVRRLDTHGLRGPLWLDATMTAYSGVASGGTTHDADLGRQESPGSWSAVRDYSGSGIVKRESSGTLMLTASGNTLYEVSRAQALFDTSLTAGKHVSSCSLSVYAVGKVLSGVSEGGIVLVQANTVYNGSAHNDDYSNMGSVAISNPLLHSGINLSASNSLSLTDLSAVSATITKIGIREYTHDLLNADPGSGNQATYTLGSVDAGGGQRPVLTVSYSSGGSRLAALLGTG